jgi:competence protein ComEC
VLELPDGQMVLIDGGARYDTLDMGRAVVAPYLWERGIARLDHVIATHSQLDHVGGLAWIVRSFDIGRYWSNGVARDEPFYRQLQDRLRAKGLMEERAAEGRPVIESGPCRLLILNPPAEPDTPTRSGGAAAAASGSALNDRSIVTTLTCGMHSLLFTADVETGALARLHHRGVVSDATVIKVPHHGAASSLYEPWIAGLKAHRAIVSVGRHNAYGHPAAAVVAAYERTGIRLLRTDRDGAVSLTGRLSDPELHIRTEREQVLRSVPIGRKWLSAELPNWENLVRSWTG